MGQPGRRYGLSSVFGRKPTRGTETSQYLEEEKSNEIPQVEAIERGRAQTGLSGSGLWGHDGDIPSDMIVGAEAAWNGPRYEVRVL